MKELKPFTIKGSIPLLKGIFQELIAIGFVDHTPKKEKISSTKLEYFVGNANDISCKRHPEQYKFIDIYEISVSTGTKYDTFNLPEDWDKAIDFAKEQLELSQSKLKKKPVKESEIVKEPKFELKVGCYFVDKSFSAHIGRITKITKERYYYDGFSVSGYYEENDWYDLNYDKEEYREATKEEIEKYLIRVAEIKGIVAGATIDKTPLDYNYSLKIWKLEGKNSYIFDFKDDSLIFNGSSDLIYAKGKWATVVAHASPHTIGKFGNITFDVYKDYIECEHGKITFITIQNIIKSYRELTSTILCGYSLELNSSISFGCCHGTIEEAEVIFELMKSL